MNCCSSFRIHHLLLLLCFLVFISISETEARLIRFKCKVHVINGFGTNKNPLVIHCRSKDDDLGEHSLWLKDEFEFKFGVSFILGTRFWCSMQCGAKNRTIDVFGETEYGLCSNTGNCFWKPYERGILFSVDNTNWRERYYW